MLSISKSSSILEKLAKKRKEDKKKLIQQLLYLHHFLSSSYIQKVALGKNTKSISSCIPPGPTQPSPSVTFHTAVGHIAFRSAAHPAVTHDASLLEPPPPPEVSTSTGR